MSQLSTKDIPKPKMNIEDKKAKHVMADIEGLGTEPGSVITSIGAVFVSIKGVSKCSFYERIDIQSCMDVGLNVDAGTLMWWFKQPDAARLELTRKGRPIFDVLEDFTAFLRYRDVRIWGNGASFDPVMLEEAYRACDMQAPWHYANARCHRTLVNTFPTIKKPAIVGTKHNALADAKAQAKHLVQLWRHAAKK